MNIFSKYFQLSITSCYLLNVGCSTVCYVPNTHHVPLFRERNELKLAGFVGGSIGVNDVTLKEVQAAYSPADHFAVMVNYAHGKSEEGDEEGRGNLWEAGVGYFTRVGDHGSFEVFGGYGFGRINYFLSDPHPNPELRFRRGFIQTDLGIAMPHFHFAFSPRVCMINFNGFPASSAAGLDAVSGRNFLTMENALTLRFGTEEAKIQLQAAFANRLSDEYFPMNNFNFGIGLFIGLAFENKNHYYRN